MSFIAKVAVDAIRRHPIINASLDGDSIVYKKDVNLGIAGGARERPHRACHQERR
jgi:2-oxoglutarate dehydrogenase E2 component (dihydrolipoamide succinyltransferase)